MTNYTWTDNTMRSGSTCNVDEVADNLMHLKYNSAGIQLGTCSTASATTEKAVTIDNFALSSGATVLVTFNNANAATSPTLNVNSTGAISIASEDGTVCSSTNPAYFPSGSTVEFTYNGTNWVFKKRVVTSYVNGTSWYLVYSNGWIEQGGFNTNGTTSAVTTNLVKEFKFTDYNIKLQTLAISPAVFSANYVTSSKTTTTFQHIGNSSTYYYFWEAKGY